jgi:hypothetical protein
MPDIVEQKLDIGRDIFGRQVYAIRTRHYTAGPCWMIVIEPSSQQDEGEKIDSLSDENIRQLTQCLAALGRR